MITIKDVARGAGVSVATVSRVHNNSRLVKEATRRRFRTIADRLCDALAPPPPVAFSHQREGVS